MKKPMLKAFTLKTFDIFCEHCLCLVTSNFDSRISYLHYSNLSQKAYFTFRDTYYNVISIKALTNYVNKSRSTFDSVVVSDMKCFYLALQKHTHLETHRNSRKRRFACIYKIV